MDHIHEVYPQYIHKVPNIHRVIEIASFFHIQNGYTEIGWKKAFPNRR